MKQLTKCAPFSVSFSSPAMLSALLAFLHSYGFKWLQGQALTDEEQKRYTAEPSNNALAHYELGDVAIVRGSTSSFQTVGPSFKFETEAGKLVEFLNTQLRPVVMTVAGTDKECKVHKDGKLTYGCTTLDRTEVEHVIASYRRLVKEMNS